MRPISQPRPKSRPKLRPNYRNNAIDKMNKEIIKIIESRNQLAQQACQEYTPLVDTIISSQTKDVNYISYTLDFMLDFCFDLQMLQLYRKLCRYLYDIIYYYYARINQIHYLITFTPCALASSSIMSEKQKTNRMLKH